MALALTVPGMIGILNIDEFSSDVIREYGGFMGLVFVVSWTVISLLGLTIFIPFITRTGSRKRFSESVTIDKAPGVEEYIDLKTKMDMETYDKFSHMSTKVKDEDDNLSDNLFMLILAKIFK